MCELNDLTYLQSTVEYWTVDEDGDPDVYIDRDVEGDLVGYRCNECDGKFETWEEAQAHLAAVGVAA